MSLENLSRQWSYGRIAKWLVIGMVLGAVVCLAALSESKLVIDGIPVWQYIGN